MRNSYNVLFKLIQNPLHRSVAYGLLYRPNEEMIHFTDKFKTGFRVDGTLQPMKETKYIQDFDDRFGLKEIRNYKIILNHLSETQHRYKLNDLIYFCRHLAHLSNEKHINRLELLHHQDFKGLLQHIKKDLITTDHKRTALIGSLAHSLNQLGVRDNELWGILEQMVLDDRYYTNFKESVFAVEAFTCMPRFLFGRDAATIQERIDKLYSRLERVVQITIWEVDPRYYARIATALASVNRFDPAMFTKLEGHILTNMSLEYETKTMVDILRAFSKGKQGSNEFYDAMQFVIFKGHMFNRNPFLKSQVQIQYNGHVVSGLLEIYQDVIKRDTSFVLHPDFKQLMHNVLGHPRTEYDVDSATKTLRIIPMLEFEDEKSIIRQVVDACLKYQGNITAEEILAFYDFIEHQFDVDKYGIPYQVFDKLEGYILASADQFTAEQLGQISNYLVNTSIKHQLQRPNFLINKRIFLDGMIRSLEKRLDELNINQIQSMSNQILSLASDKSENSPILPSSNSLQTEQDIFTVHSQQISQRLADMEKLRLYRIKQNAALLKN